MMRGRLHSADVRDAVMTEPPIGLERLEPRVLLSAFQYTPIVEAFDLERFVREIAAPEGVADGQRFGTRVIGMGDVDGDGVDDLAVSAPGFREPGVSGPWRGEAGAVFVFSGRTLEVVRALEDGFAGFGAALANLGDVDGDGVADLAVGSPNWSGDGAPEGAGRVWVYSGADGSVISAMSGATEGEELGYALAAAGDVDGDGATDLIVGAPGGGAEGAGRAYIYSASGGVTLRVLEGTQAGERFGHSVSGGVDLPRLAEEEFDDGIGEFIVGAPANDLMGTDAGRAYIFDGASGEVRGVLSGEQAGEWFGAAVLMVDGGTVNRAFNIRIVVGSPGYDLTPFDAEPLVDAGRVQTFTAVGFGTPFGPLYSDEAGARLGEEAFIVGELSPGITQTDEYAVTAPGASDPAMRLRLFALPGDLPLEETPAAGASYAVRAGDLDGDGILDLAAGFPGEQSPVVRVMPLTLATSRLSITGASDSGRYYVLRSSFTPGDAPPMGYVVKDGAVTPMTTLPGLGERDGLFAVNDVGLFIGSVEGDGDGSAAGVLERHFFYTLDGVRMSLAGAVTRIEGPAPTGLTLVRLNNVGDALFQGAYDGGNGAYLFSGGVLTFLWDGLASDLNDLGMVVGTTRVVFEGNPPTQPVGVGIARLPDRTIREIPGMIRATGVNNRGVIAGTDQARRLALWEAGGMSVAAEVPVGPPAYGANWEVKDFKDDGRMLATLTYFMPITGRPPSVHPSIEYIFTPAGGLQEAKDAVVGEPESVFFINAMRLTDSGVLVLPGALATPPPSAIDGSAAEGFPRSTAVDRGGFVVTAINREGEAIVLRGPGGAGEEWTGRVLPTGDGPLLDVITYTDPSDGRSYAVVRDADPSRLLWFKVDAEGFYTPLRPIELHEGQPGIAGPLLHFTGIDNRAMIVALDEAGDLIAFVRTGVPGPFGEFEWEYANLSLDLRNRGLETPRFVGELTGFTTRWNAMHIAGLDEAGDVQVVWWAPALPGGWTVENLSERAGTPTLQGRLASYVTAWDALTILGTAAESGNLIATWWFPTFGADWAVNDLTLDSGASLRLESGSITAFVTDWAGLNIAGIDAQTGEAAVYWWTPETNRWIAERFSIAPPTTGEAVLRPAGPLTSEARGTALSVFGRTEEGEIVRLFWHVGDGGVWSIQNLTALVG